MQTNTFYDLIQKFLKKKNTFKLCIFVFIISFISRIYDLFSPYKRTILDAGSTNFWHIAGQNHLNIKYWTFLFSPVLNTGINLEPSVYFNHPSLTSFYLSIFYFLFGSSVIVTKIAALIAWYGISYLIYKLASHYSVKLGYYALIASFLLPFINIFSNSIDCIGGPLIVLFSLLFYYGLEKKKSNSFIIFSMILAAFSEWSFIPLLIACLCIPKYKEYRKLLFLTGIIIYLFLVSLYIYHSKSFDLISVISSHTKGHISFEVSVFNLLSRIFITYIITYFTPFIFIGYYFVFKKNKNLYLPLIIQPLAMILFFPHGAYKHVFWICTLIPFACLSIAEFFKVLKQKYIYLVIGILIYSTAYTFYIKHRGQTNIYKDLGQTINSQTKSDQIIYMYPPENASDKLSESLLIGYYASRDIVFLDSLKSNPAVFWSCNKTICKSN